MKLGEERREPGEGQVRPDEGSSLLPRREVDREVTGRFPDKRDAAAPSFLLARARRQVCVCVCLCDNEVNVAGMMLSFKGK